MRTNVAAVSVGVLYSVCMTVSHHWERSFFKVFFHKSRVVGEYPVNEELKKKKFNCTNQEIRSTGVKELKKLKVFVL